MYAIRSYYVPNNQLAIIFGPEDSGLTNDELKYCRYISSIPTADFSSLNLAQAIAIHCYELYYQIVYAPHAFEPKPHIATSHELDRITSYNVCYTKLLRTFCRAYSVGALKLSCQAGSRVE